MKKYIKASLFILAVTFIGNTAIKAQVLLDAHSSSVGASNWSITTTHPNELILISTGGCCAGLNNFAGTVTVNGANATYILGTNCSGFFPAYIWAYVAAVPGLYNIVCTELGGISNPWWFNYSASVYIAGTPLTLANILLGGTNTNVGPTTITTTITTTVANAYIYGNLVYNDNFATGVIGWTGLTQLDNYYEAPSFPGVDGSQGGLTVGAAALYTITGKDIGATNPYAAIVLIAVQPPVGLPVELLNFSCQGDENGVKVFWSTATETNSKEYTVERSVDGIDFTTIATVPAAGNSVSQRNYTYVDESPLLGGNYYRLSETDLDGTVHMYYVTNCSNNKAALNQIYPNPSRGNFTVALGGSESYQTLTLTDLMGRQVYSQQFAPNPSPDTYNVNVPSNLKGIYVATILDNNQAIAVKKLVIY